MPSRSSAVLLLVFTCALGAARTARPATITVTDTGDNIAVDGSVTLREAIASVNGAANVNADVVAAGTYGSGDTIAFNIPGAGPHTILVGGTALPVIVRPVTIRSKAPRGSRRSASKPLPASVIFTDGSSSSSVDAIKDRIVAETSTTRMLRTDSSWPAPPRSRLLHRCARAIS